MVLIPLFIKLLTTWDWEEGGVFRSFFKILGPISSLGIFHFIYAENSLRPRLLYSMHLCFAQMKKKKKEKGGKMVIIKISTFSTFAL